MMLCSLHGYSRDILIESLLISTSPFFHLSRLLHYYLMHVENTITGSIGVASLRPTFTKKFFDRFFVGIQSFFTGSQASSSLHDLDEQQIQRQRENIDEMYGEFLKKVRPLTSLSMVGLTLKMP